ncbi:hypothetical protein [Dactylosporangium sp. CA-092794]|uniref:hypothetical protein n=1 Tax=Dactylosporangium sp. CA-092794 TaxID=3239929 RepID=UPI003D928073
MRRAVGNDVEVHLRALPGTGRAARESAPLAAMTVGDHVVPGLHGAARWGGARSAITSRP